MILSNEPGYYLQDKYGIRIENLTYVKQAEKADANSNSSFLEFDDLTYIPLEKDLFDFVLLDEREIDYINEYHQKCLDKLTSFDFSKSSTKENSLGISLREWSREEMSKLEEMCKPIDFRTSANRSIEPDAKRRRT